MKPSAKTTFLKRMSPRSRIFLGLGIIVLVLVVFFFLFYSRQTSKVTNLTKEMHDLDSQIMILKAGTKNKQKIEDRVKKLDSEIKLIATVLPEKKEIPELLKSISSSGRMAGLEFLLFEPGNEIKTNHVAEIPVEVKIQGTYTDTASFFYQLSRLSRVVNVDRFVMGEGIPRERGIVLTSNFTLKTFRLLTEAEVKALKEQREAEEKSKKKKKK